MTQVRLYGPATLKLTPSALAGQSFHYDGYPDNVSPSLLLCVSEYSSRCALLVGGLRQGMGDGDDRLSASHKVLVEPRVDTNSQTARKNSQKRL